MVKTQGTNEVSTNLTPIVAAMAELLTEPYEQFLVMLHAAGRITDAEVGAVRQAVLERSQHVPELFVRTKLPQPAPPGDPGQDSH